ncbi:MAG: hypothetical protein HY980_00045 [Candidatus Magasanikbacteria bacterium]|nr:hypothetical protein [Candidatus Magasanikbacteria bacterium]
MTLTGGMAIGDLNNTLSHLQGDGVDGDDFAAIGKDGALRADIVAVILRHRLFTSPEVQIRRLLEINEAVWKDAAITPEAIRAIGDPPDCPVSDEHGLYCVCLFSETGDAVRTFARNWEACVHVHGEDGTWKWDGLRFTSECVRQRVGAIVRPIGLRWQVAELGRQFQKQSVANVRPQLGKVMGIGQELPFIAVMHPKWAVSMNGDTIPFVDAPDLEMAPSALGAFSSAPFLGFSRGNRRVFLGADLIGPPFPRFRSGSLR